MRRNKQWALKLLSILQDNDAVGAGLYRSDLHQEFERDNSGLRLSAVEVVDIVDYHLHLLETEAYVFCEPDNEDSLADNFLLTWSGHDYLDSN